MACRLLRAQKRMGRIPLLTRADHLIRQGFQRGMAALANDRKFGLRLISTACILLGMKRRIPYAVANYEKIVGDHYYFVDKTRFIHELEKIRDTGIPASAPVW
jgi:hypothetical protein